MSFSSWRKTCCLLSHPSPLVAVTMTGMASESFAQIMPQHSPSLEHPVPGASCVQLAIVPCVCVGCFETPYMPSHAWAPIGTQPSPPAVLLPNHSRGQLALPGAPPTPMQDHLPFGQKIKTHARRRKTSLPCCSNPSCFSGRLHACTEHPPDRPRHRLHALAPVQPRLEKPTEARTPPNQTRTPLACGRRQT